MNRIQFNLPPGTNVALASNGATATVSSTYSGGGSYPASGVNNGDRKGLNWGAGGGWNDDTANTYPDWVQVSFNGSKTINEIDVFTLQDNYASPSEPTEAMTFSQYGIVDFKVQYWDGVAWTAVSGGVVTGNNKVWRKFTFSSLTTDKIRVRATNALNSYSRVTEIEAYQVATPAYDAAGNVTNDGAHTYEYDSENRIVSVDGGSTASYVYDNQNRRYKKTIGSTVTHYVWQGSQVLAEHNGSTGAVLTDYVCSGSRMIARISSGVTQYFLSDRLSARLTLDASGNVVGRQGHLPFGEDFGESGSQEKHHFTSFERDTENGVDYAVNRQYLQSMGRFMRPDPIAGSIDNPQSLNRYSYTNNEPVDQIDPTGLAPYYCPAWIHNCSSYLGVPGFSGSITIGAFGGSGGEGGSGPVFGFDPKPKRLYPGFGQTRLNILSTAKDGAVALLNSGNCKANLAAKTIKGFHIDGDKVEQELINLYVKPEGLDESEPGTEPFSGRTYNVFDGSASELGDIKKQRGRDVGAVFNLSYIFLFNVFFDPPTNSSARIGLDETRALGLLHETIHLFDFRDEDFSANGKDKWGLQDFIIKSCINPNYDHNDTAF